MEHSATPDSGQGPPKFSPNETRILLVDDEERFRTNLSQRLTLRGFVVKDVGDPEKAIRLVRQMRPDVVVLDRKMPKMDGEELLAEIKRISPEVQVIMLTGFASMDSAAHSGRLDAYAYLEKPCETERLIATILAARQEKVYAMARHEIPHVKSTSWARWLLGTHNSRPGLIMLAFLIMAAFAFLIPLPQDLVSLLGFKKTGQTSDAIAGFPKYQSLKDGETIADYYLKAANRGGHKGAAHEGIQEPQKAQTTARKALIMIGILLVAALFWGSGAMPIGITALLAGLLMYLFDVFPPDIVAKAYAKDAVIFIMGVLAMSAGVAKTGLDRRIGLMLLGASRNLELFLFLFCPMLGVSAAFFSEHALVAFIAPILMLVYMSAIRHAGLKEDRELAVMMILAMCFSANLGGPGSPAAGGRNAVMVGILADYGQAPTFAQWMMYGLPFVPIAGLCTGAYFYLRLRRKVKIGQLNVAKIVKTEAARIGRMTREEYITAAILTLVIVLWITAGDEEGGGLGMGGPVLLGIVLLSMFRIITWRDVNRIPWDVVALYGSACAIGYGLATTGSALWIAKKFVDMLPPWLSQGEGLCVASSIISGVLTQIMSDGATVSAVGPITVPMASLSGTPPWNVGFATAFASSFANCFLSGTPNNAIAYSLAKDLNTGEQLVTIGDFFKHGLVVSLLAMLVLWFGIIYGYWRWMGFY